MGAGREIFALFGTITVDGLEFVQKGMDALDTQVQAAQKSLVTLGRQASSVGKTLSTDITAPLAAVGAGVALLTGKTVEYAASLDKLKDVTGLNTDALQELKHVANDTGVDFETITGACEKFTKELPQIIKEGGPAFDALRKLGVNVFDANGKLRNMNDLFPDLIKRLQNINDPLMRNATAMQIFGKNTAELGPILALTNQKFDGLMQGAKAAGLVMSEGSIEAFKEFGIELKDLKEQFDVLIRSLAADFLPILRDTVLPLVREKIIPAIQEFAGKISDLVTWFKNLDGPTKSMILTIGGLAAALGPALLIFGKTILAINGLVKAFALARTAAIAFTTTMAVNPFAVAIIGAGALVALLLQLQSFENQRKSNEAKTKENEAIAAQIADFEKLKKEQQEIIQTGEASHFQLYSKQSVADAKANLKSIQDALHSFLVEKGLANAKTETPTAAGPANLGMTEKDKDKQLKFYQDLVKGYKEADDKEKKADAELAKAHAENSESMAEEAEKLYDEDQKLIEKRAKENQEWDLKAAEQSGNMFTVLANQRKKDLKDAEGNAEAQAKINLYYDKETSKAKIQLAESWASKITDLLSKLGGILAQNSDNQIQRIENEQTVQEDAINNSTDSEANKKKRIDALHADTAQKESDIKRKAAEEQKAIAIMEAVINTAVAVVEALASSGPPMNFFMAALVGALGAAEIAVIASEPLPLAEGAFVRSRPGGVKATVGEGRDDEVVLPMAKGAKAMVEAMFKHTNSDARMYGPSRGASRYGSAGSQKPVEHHWHIGTLVADDHGIKELERRMLPFRTAEQKRKGG